MDWFSITILCAFSLASSDALAKKYLGSYSAWALVLIRFFVPGVLLLPVLFIYPLPDAPPVFWAWLAVLFPLELLAMTLYMKAIRDAPLYQTLPYLAFTPVFNIVTGWLVLGEQVSLTGGLGILMVVLGAYYLNLEQLNNKKRFAWMVPLQSIMYQQGSRRMLMAAIIYSFTSVAGKAAMAYVEPMSFGALYFVLLGLLTLLLVAVLKPKELLVLKTNIKWNLAVGGLMAVMVVTHFLALSMVEAAYMIAVKRISLLFGILYGAYFFQEKGLVRNLSAAMFMVVGVSMILLA
jgi:drug/metabolite transporter (DMT)-like permease